MSILTPEELQKVKAAQNKNTQSTTTSGGFDYDAAQKAAEQQLNQNNKDTSVEDVALALPRFGAGVVKGLGESAFNSVDALNGLINKATSKLGLGNLTSPKDKAAFDAFRNLLLNNQGIQQNVDNTVPGQIGKAVGDVGSYFVAPGLKTATLPGKIGTAARILEQGGIGAAQSYLFSGGQEGSAKVGGAAGAGIQGLAEALTGKGRAIGASIMNQVLGSKGIKSFGFGKNPGEGFAKYGISGSSLDDLYTKGNAALQSIGSEVGQLMDKASAATKNAVKNIKIDELIKPIQDLKKPESGIQITPEMLSEIQRVENSLKNSYETVSGEAGDLVSKMVGPRDTSNLNKIFKLKQTIADLTNFDKKFVEKPGVNRDDLNKALQQVYTNTKDKIVEIANKANPALGKRIDELNQDYANVLTGTMGLKKKIIDELGQSFLKKHGISTVSTILPLIAGYMAEGNTGPIIAGALTGLVGGSLAESKSVATNLAKLVGKEDLGGIAGTIRDAVANRLGKGKVPTEIKVPTGDVGVTHLGEPNTIPVQKNNEIKVNRDPSETSNVIPVNKMGGFTSPGVLGTGAVSTASLLGAIEAARHIPGSTAEVSGSTQRKVINEKKLEQKLITGNLKDYDITPYATDPEHEAKIKKIYEGIIKKDRDFTNPSGIDKAIKENAPKSKITGNMIFKAAKKEGVDPKLLFAIMLQDSSLGTKGLGAKNNNPGNVGQFDYLKGAVRGYRTLEEGVHAVAAWLKKHKIK